MGHGHATYVTLKIAVETLIRAEHQLRVAHRASDRAWSNSGVMFRWFNEGNATIREDLKLAAAQRLRERAEALVDALCEELDISPAQPPPRA